MIKNLKWKALFVTLIVASSIWLVYPPEERINLGLDLKGGMHLVLKVDTSKIAKGSEKDATKRALEIIRNRIDQFGVTEPSIQLQGENRIIVELPGIEERQRAVELIGRTALLEFKLVASQQETEETLNRIDKESSILNILNVHKSHTQEGVPFKTFTFDAEDTEKIKKIINNPEVKEEIPYGYALAVSRVLEEGKEEFRQLYLLKKDAEITGDSLTDAYWTTDEMNNYSIMLKFNYKGRNKLRQLTHEAAEKYNNQQQISRLAIILDDSVYSAPLMKVEVASNPVIEGSFTKKEADDLALVLRAGSLPAPIKIEEERMVGPTLGKDSVEAGVTAAIVGGILVLVFMGIYYLYAGLIANFALCLNIIIILGTLSYFNATLTLPGIAGIILTIGMAVDANVLIFERIREELKQGKGIRYAIKGGYHKVFSTILDANLTTLITAFILYKVGTGPIRGFAVTLMIGIVASIFTALVVTRLIFDYLTIKWRLLKNLPMLEILKRERFDFISKRKIAYIVSVVVIASGVIVFAIRGNANFGIDFTGGTLQQIHFENEPDINKVRTSLASVGLKAATISRFGDKKDILIKTDKAYPKEIEKTLNEVFADNKAETVRLERVGPTVGKQLRYKALWAILFAMVAICIYITIRFEFRFAICALIALFHDVLVTLGIFSMSARELSLPIIAAILTIIGYSLNDTIVVFDRIREDLQLLKRTSFKDIVNTSINQTFSRTLITSLTTLIAVLSLYFLGGSVINDFALILLIGVIVGTYSSIFIAAPILVEWQKRGRR